MIRQWSYNFKARMAFTEIDCAVHTSGILSKHMGSSLSVVAAISTAVHACLVLTVLLKAACIHLIIFFPACMPPSIHPFNHPSI